MQDHTKGSDRSLAALKSYESVIYNYERIESKSFNRKHMEGKSVDSPRAFLNQITSTPALANRFM